MAPFSKEDQFLIKNLKECTGYNALQFITEFPDKGWTKNSINRMLVKLRKFVCSHNYVCQIMSLGICFKKLHLVKVGTFQRLCLIQRQNSRYFRSPVWKTKSW